MLQGVLCKLTFFRSPPLEYVYERRSSRQISVSAPPPGDSVRFAAPLEAATVLLAPPGDLPRRRRAEEPSEDPAFIAEKMAGDFEIMAGNVGATLSPAAVSEAGDGSAERNAMKRSETDGGDDKVRHTSC